MIIEDDGADHDAEDEEHSARLSEALHVLRCFHQHSAHGRHRAQAVRRVLKWDPFMLTMQIVFR